MLARPAGHSLVQDRASSNTQHSTAHSNMQRWAGRVAVVTGASAGIGAAISEALVRHGMKVVGLARRVDRVQVLAQQLKGESGELHAVKADVTKDAEVLAAFEWVRKNLGGVDVLVNNAGMNIQGGLLDGKPEDWRYMLDLNIVALCLCTREAVKSMRDRGVDDGHVIHITSTLAYQVTNFPVLGFYTSTKFAVRALGEALDRELRQAKSHIRVSTVAPGLTKTEFNEKSVTAEHAAMTADAYSVMPYIEPKDIANGVITALSTPPNVQIPEIIVRATSENF